MKLLKLILPFLLFALATNLTFATVSHKRNELKEHKFELEAFSKHLVKNIPSKRINAADGFEFSPRLEAFAKEKGIELGVDFALAVTGATAVKHIVKGTSKVVTFAGKLGIKTKEGIKKLAGLKQQKQVLEGLEGVTKHELYKKQLRQTMPKPNVQDTKLKKIVNNLYRPNAKVGSGSTADALRYEKLKGGTVGGKEHAIKARERVTNLRSWLKNNPNASSTDKSAAEQMMLDLMDALGDI